MVLKTFKQAPLPFIGQKRMFITHYRQLLDNLPNEGKGWTVVDAFGGSGLLSHVAKRFKPQLNVIYNDFDNYSERLKHIADTNRLRRELFALLSEHSRKKKLNEANKKSVIDAINAFDGFVDMRVVSTWILFSGSYVLTPDELSNKTLYNCIRLGDFPCADDYLDGITIVNKDFEPLLLEHQNDDKALFVLDPPYVCTQQGMYANDTYFGMVEFLRLMRLVRPPFVFFSSTRSELLDYMNFVIKHKLEGWQRLTDYERVVVKSSINHSAKYEDNMIYKLR